MEENKILAYVRGNDVLFIVSVTTPEIDGEGQPIEDSYVPVDFTGWDDYSLRVVKQGVTRTIVAESSQLVEGEDGKIVVDVPYTAQCGTYSLELVGRQNGRHERSYEIMMFAIVESNDKANLIYEIIDGYKSTDLDITVQMVSSAVVYGENAYQMWKHRPGNEDKTLQDYIDEVLDFNGVMERVNMAVEHAEDVVNEAHHLPYIGADNYVYEWNKTTGEYHKTDTYVKGEQGERGLQGEQGEQGLQGIQGPQGIQGEKGDYGIGIGSVEFAYTDLQGNRIYEILYTDGRKTTFISPRGPAGQDGTNGANGTDGVGISNIEFKSTTPGGDNTYTITLTNGNTYDFTALRGVMGPRGTNGTNGTNGVDGTDGVGIASISYKTTDASGNYVYTITLTNDDTYDITCPKGAPGDTPSDVVKYTSQSLTSTQKGQARTNIGAQEIIDSSNKLPASNVSGLANVATSGSYNDLSDTPSIPSEVTEQTISGWGFTKNTGTYSKPSGGIPSTDLSSGVQTSLGNADSAYQKPSGGIPSTDIASGVIPDVSNKADKATTLAGYGITDAKIVSGVITLGSDSITPLTSAPVTSVNGQTGAVTLSIPDVSTKEDKVTIESASGATLTAEVGKYYTLSNVGTLAITLPTIAAGTTKVQTVTFYVSAGSSPAVTWTSTHTVIFADGFQIKANGLYEISAAWNSIGWIVGMLKLVAPSS